MSGPWFIEMLARNGDVLHRHQVNALPIRLGRGYDNDFIIDDAYAAPRHAQIDAREDGELILHDLDSRNGVIHRGKRSKHLVMTGDTVIRIGHTSLRVRAADYQVAPELLDRTRHGWEGLAPGLLGILLIGLCAVFMVWLNDTQSFQLVRYLQALAFGIGGGLVWSGAWAFGNRLFGRHARLGRHLFILGCGLTALTAHAMVASVVGYAFSLESLTRYGSHVIIVIVAGMLYYHLNTVKPHNARRFAVTCLILAILASGLRLLSNEQRTGQLADHPYMSVILPPALRVSPDRSVDDFMQEVDQLKVQVELERARKLKDDSLDED